jgi:EasF-like predicted methyltransferase
LHHQAKQRFLIDKINCTDKHLHRNLRKVKILLDALEHSGKHIDYYALDLSRVELERTLAAVPTGAYAHVRCHGLYGTYDDGLAWLKRPEIAARPKCIMSLGSSIGNFNREESADFLQGFADILCPGDSFLIAVDGCQDKERVFHAYNDREGKTHEFVLNGLVQANRLLGKEVFDISEWYVAGGYNVEAGRHEAFVCPKKDIEVEGVLVRKDERVRIEESYKYSVRQERELYSKAGLCVGATWGDGTGSYRECSCPYPCERCFSVFPSLFELINCWHIVPLFLCQVTSVFPCPKLDSCPRALFVREKFCPRACTSDSGPAASIPTGFLFCISSIEASNKM